MHEHYLRQAHDMETRLERMGVYFESLTQWNENAPDKRWVAKRSTDGATFYGATPQEAVGAMYKAMWRNGKVNPHGEVLTDDNSSKVRPGSREADGTRLGFS